MRDIKDALKELSLVHDKYQIDGFYRALHAAESNWPAELPRSIETDLFYDEYEPCGVRLETGLTPLKMFDLASLKKAQLGYRWVNSAESVVLNDDWPHQDLVIMDDSGGGKPIIAVTDVEKTPVFASYDVVECFQVADSLADFILALARLVDIVYGRFNIFDISSDEGVSSIFLTLLSEEVTPILGEHNAARFVDYFYG
ncbi:hypothetical protein [Pseudomonas sp. WHRI 8519]|uniref:hypothetical protein n=1 Tax=Pseudomonas sp. WHRI 8519 TaxID=3162567 RepID=UPI0032ED427A